MKFAIMRMGYDATYAIPVVKLSKFLEMLDECTLVRDEYISHLERNVVFKDDRNINREINLIDEILDEKPEVPSDV
jgi:hypothetical protein